MSIVHNVASEILNNSQNSFLSICVAITKHDLTSFHVSNEKTAEAILSFSDKEADDLFSTLMNMLKLVCQ